MRPVLRAHDLQVGREQLRDIVALPQPPDAVLILAELLRPRMRKIVTADASVRVEIRERLVFLPHQEQQPREQRMLEYVGEVSSVEQMAVGEHIVLRGT